MRFYTTTSDQSRVGAEVEGRIVGAIRACEAFGYTAVPQDSIVGYVESFADRATVRQVLRRMRRHEIVNYRLAPIIRGSERKVRVYSSTDVEPRQVA